LRSDEWKLFFDRRYALEGPGTGRITPEQEAKVAPYREALKPGVPAPPMLFNLNKDLGETVDLSAEETEKVKSIASRAEEIAAAIKADGILPISKAKKEK